LQAYSTSLPIEDPKVKKFKEVLLKDYVLKSMEFNDQTTDADLLNLLRVLQIEYPQKTFEALNDS
jgi:hypothetical protein